MNRRTDGLERQVKGAEWVFTGEGSVDAQTVMGKTPFGVAQIAARNGARVVIFAAGSRTDASVLLEHVVTARRDHRIRAHGRASSSS